MSSISQISNDRRPYYGYVALLFLLLVAVQCASVESSESCTLDLHRPTSRLRAPVVQVIDRAPKKQDSESFSVSNDERKKVDEYGADDDEENAILDMILRPLRALELSDVLKPIQPRDDAVGEYKNLTEESTSDNTVNEYHENADKYNTISRRKLSSPAVGSPPTSTDTATVPSLRGSPPPNPEFATTPFDATTTVPH